MEICDFTDVLVLFHVGHCPCAAIEPAQSALVYQAVSPKEAPLPPGGGGSVAI